MCCLTIRSVGSVHEDIERSGSESISHEVISEPRFKHAVRREGGSDTLKAL